MNRNKLKNILIITPGFPIDENDDSCIPPLQEFLIEFKNSFPQINFFVVALQYPFQKRKYYWNGIPVYSCGGKNKSFPLRFLSWIKAFQVFIDIKMKNKIHIIHSFWFGEAAFISNILSYFFRIPHINTLMGQEVLKENKYLKLITGKRHKIIAISERQKDFFQQNSGKENIDIIPFGITMQNHPSRNNGREIDILGVGSLIELKNYKLFVNTVKQLAGDFPNLNCFLIGDGEQKNFLVKLAQELNIQNNLHFTGKISRKEVFNFMKKSKILFHPSKYESLGYVYEEALMFGMTIVSFNTGISEKSERWIVANNVDEVVPQIKKLIKTNLDYSSLIPYPIDVTVKKYSEMYDLL